MLRRFTKKRVILALGVVAALVVAGAAVAFFTSTGTGTGSAQVGSAAHWTMTPSAATGGPMFPGSGTSTIAYTVKNPGADNRHLNGTSAAVANDGATPDANIVENGSPVAGCHASWFTATDTGPGAQNVPGGATVSGSVAVTMQDSGTDQSSCQSHNPDITISAN